MSKGSHNQHAVSAKARRKGKDIAAVPDRRRRKPAAVAASVVPRAERPTLISAQAEPAIVELQKVAHLEGWPPIEATYSGGPHGGTIVAGYTSTYVRVTLPRDGEPYPPGKVFYLARQPDTVTDRMAAWVRCMLRAPKSEALDTDPTWRCGLCEFTSSPTTTGNDISEHVRAAHRGARLPLVPVATFDRRRETLQRYVTKAAHDNPGRTLWPGLMPESALLQAGLPSDIAGALLTCRSMGIEVGALPPIDVEGEYATVRVGDACAEIDLDQATEIEYGIVEFAKRHGARTSAPIRDAAPPINHPSGGGTHREWHEAQAGGA